VPEACAVGLDKLFVIFFWNYQVFTMSEVNTKTQNIVSTISAESILITLGFNWIQALTSVFIIDESESRGAAAVRDKCEEQMTPTYHPIVFLEFHRS
jgi:hypothetical protein